MWLFTKYGFFSPVCAREGDGAKGQPVDVNKVMVRARRRDHLEKLMAAFPDQLSVCSIAESQGTDYPVRIFVAKSAWVEVMAGLANELDYDNFKEKAGAVHGHSSPYVTVLGKVWQTGLNLQE